MISIIIVAGGSGKRMQSTIPKQFIPLNKLPIIMHTLQRFHKTVKHLQHELILVLPENQIDYWEELCFKYKFNLSVKIAPGGKERFDSVKNGLQKIDRQSEICAIHDAVRPFVSDNVILNTISTARKKGAAIPVVPLTDSIRQVSENGSKAVLRSNYVLVQTPQCFKTKIIKTAYLQPYKKHFTDDASVVEHLGHTIVLTEGNKENIKITTPLDLQIAECLLKTNFI